MKKILASTIALLLLLVGVISPISSAKAATTDTVTYNIRIYQPYIKPAWEYALDNPTNVDPFTYDVTLHYGVNGWNNIQDLKMTKNIIYSKAGVLDVEYNAQVTVNKGDVVDFAVYVDRSSLNEPSQWYNNNGNDYHVSEQTASAGNYFYLNCKTNN